jgi:hypothetical protein
MIDRVDKRLVFNRLDNRPYLCGETEPCINGRILGIGAYFKKPNDALANQLLGEQLEDGGWNCEAPKSGRSSFHTTICVLEGLQEYERAGRKSSAITKSVTKSVTRARKGPKTICSSAVCSARFELAKSSTNGGYDFRSRRFGTTTSCADSIICGMQELAPTAGSMTPSKS